MQKSRGNNLDNNCIVELLLILGDPKAPRITQLDLAINTTLTWQCTRALSIALGARPASEDGGNQAPAPELKVSTLNLKRLLLSGTKLGDKGASEMASALRHNRSLKSLSLSRCGIGDTGGRALMDALATNTTLASLDVSWNALRADSARLLSEALLQNGGIQHLDLSHNGFSDADAARIIKALGEHGHWRHVDLSYNNVGAGAAMVLGSLAKKLAEATARRILDNSYAHGWDPEVQAGFIDCTGWFDPDPILGHDGHHEQDSFQTTPPESDSSQPSVPNPSTGDDATAANATTTNNDSNGNSNQGATNTDSSGRGAAGSDSAQVPAPNAAKPSPPPPPPAASAPAGKQEPALLGAQLTHGPLLLDLGGNPLGTSGSLQEQRAQEAEQAAALERANSKRKNKPRYAFYDAAQEAPKAEVGQQEQLQPEASNPEDNCDEEEEMLPWPLYVSIQGSNVMISDSLQEDAHVTLSGGAQRDPHSPNPFLQSIVTIMLQDQSQGKKSKGSAQKNDGRGPGSAKGSKKRGDNGPSKEYVFTAESQAIDTTSPAGQYKLDLSHPASAVIVSKILGLRTKLTELAAAGKASAGVSMAIKDITINDKPIKMDRLEAAAEAPSGILSMNVAAPSLLLAVDPWPIKDAVVGWMIETLEERGAGDLFKLAVIDVACSRFFFSAPQALQMLDLFDPEMSSSERLHAAEVLYTRCYNPLDFWEAALPELSEMQAEVIKHSLGKLGALNIQNPSGRFMLNLSRSVDRLMALRLQTSSALEAPWNQHRYFINWRNAQLNGVPLDPEGLAKKLRDYTIPAAGTLKIDYVMYQILSQLRPNVVKVLDTVQRLVNRSGLKRARQMRCALQVFAAHHFITSAQLVQVLRVLRYEQDRGTAFVALWSRVTDREGLFDTWQELGVEEQRQVQQRLGHWHVWTTLARPNGLHMYLDIKEPEQHDIARDVVKMAVKESLKSKAAARKQGQLQGSQQLANLHGNGQLLLMPEDDKTWSMLESSYNTLEFDFVPNMNQSSYKTSKAAQSIQWKWLAFCAARNKVASIGRAPAPPVAAPPEEAQMPQGSGETGSVHTAQQQAGELEQDHGTGGESTNGEAIRHSQ
ncbi:hypothetical protein DUNSADRAFT_11434 [Dunaliella salina]|uniref:Uncharacterized protein n=1 Tax=Dunaliella salina TaxID=3046 RepID=A0ABQ7GDD3_DUNSA|nr:hypothetical protein DUNSADRAFT_11434 [Dunaliella salina]|eukprot:KAF5832617.1 hypothetical protein DUNSADRAFT_11434 [Dunaliella salina]